jgi:hypothetical protein
MEPMGETVFQRRPPLVRQREGYTCWAAALESWLHVSSVAAPPDQDWICRRFAAWLTPNRSLAVEGLAPLARAFAMSSQILTGPELTGAFFAERLRRGHLYMGYRPSPGFVNGHVIVVYGVGPSALEYMDPAEGYVSKPLEFFSTRFWAFVGWASGLPAPPLEPGV